MTSNFSRNLIIRELQRTNLDVNLAVNNLLSRDDEGEGEDEDSQDSYAATMDKLSKVPPLVQPGEVDALREQLAAAARGEKFIVQGGDPTGTGRGGESVYGHTFKDEGGYLNRKSNRFTNCLAFGETFKS